jgi:hypothetical protein
LVEWARRRCNRPQERDKKFYEGIKVNLTGGEAKMLWERDGAASMKVPSLDRVDSSKDYVFDNCRIIEKSLNERLPHLSPEALAALSISVDAEAIYV